MNKQEIKSLIKQGFTNNDLSKKYNCSVSTVRRFLKKNNLQRQIEVAHPNLKENIFECIDTKEKAYWLGFLYADGCVFKESGNKKYYRITLDLSEKDVESVERFCEFMGANKDKITTLIRKEKYVSKCIAIRSKQITYDLEKIGCVPCKSKIIRLPDLSNKKLNLAFLLGFYDGDGDENSCYLTCGSYDFLLDIKSKYNIDSKLKKTDQNTYRFNLKSNLVNQMLDNHKDSMPRKRKTYNVVKKPKKGRKLKFHVTKDELECLLREYSREHIGRMFGVSGNSIKRRSVKFGLL